MRYIGKTDWGFEQCKQGGLVGAAALGAITGGVGSIITGGAILPAVIKGAAIGAGASLAKDILTPEMPEFQTAGGGGGGAAAPPANVPTPTQPVPDMPEVPGTQPEPSQPVGNAPATNQDVQQGRVNAARKRRGRLSTILSTRSRITEPLGGLYENETLG